MKIDDKTQRPTSSSHIANSVMSQRINPPVILTWVELGPLKASVKLSGGRYELFVKLSLGYFS